MLHPPGKAVMQAKVGQVLHHHHHGGLDLNEATVSDTEDAGRESEDALETLEDWWEGMLRRRQAAEKVAEKWAHKTSVNPLYVEYPDNELMNVNVPKYIELEVILDSGAGAHVASKRHVPGYAVMESELSKAVPGGRRDQSSLVGGPDL